MLFKSLHNSPLHIPGPKAWGAQIFSSANFPDKRLNARAAKVIAAMAAKPADSIPQAFAKWSGTKGAYRFIENDRVKSEEIAKPVSDAGARACAPHTTILAIQDTTGATFPWATRMSGLGPVNGSATKGLCLHTTLAVSLDGLPQGILDMQCWARAEKTAGEKGKAKKSSVRPIEEKESAKWLRGIEAAHKALERNLMPHEEPPLIHVFDREGDIHDIFAEILARGDGAVIRSVQNRNVKGGKAHENVRSAPVLAEVEFQAPRSQGQAARPPAHLQLRACPMTLVPHSHNHPERKPLELTLVEVWEPEPPEGVKEPLHWLLWTTEEVTTPAQATRIVNIYKLRWRIEDFHTVLKCGCGIEELRFETAERTTKAIFLYAPVAVRILQLRDLARTKPDICCTTILSNNEWRALWTYIHESPPAADEPPPTLGQATRWIGRIGGHLGRKSDGTPGMRSLWRGWRDLSIMAELFQSATQQS
jgi:hypothetical protein